MESRSVTNWSLICRLRNRNSADWAVFCEHYIPKIKRWCRKENASVVEAEDIAQDIVLMLFKTINEKDFDKTKSFRAWLKVVSKRTLQKARQKLKRERQIEFLDKIQDQSFAEELFAIDEDEQFKRACTLVKQTANARDWLIFEDVVFSALPAAKVAVAHNVKIASVYVAKSQIASRIKRYIKEWEEADDRASS